MKPPLQGGTILLTGASSGIGWELALQLAHTAKKLILVARRQERLENLKIQLQQKNTALDIHIYPCDLSDLPVIDRMLEDIWQEVGEVDILINNAGMGDVGLFELANWKNLQATLQLNIVSLTYLTHRLLPAMLKKNKGGILNISSGFGLTFMPGLAVYVASKHYVSAFSESLRLELHHTGIVVTQVCPGPVPTEFEQISGNPTGQTVPKWLQISPETCARISLQGFSQGKALVIPGFPIRPLTRLGMYSPRFLLRALYSPIGKYLRKQQFKESLLDRNSEPELKS